MAITTAAHIMFAKPNSLLDRPTIWPRTLNQPIIQPTMGRRYRGHKFAEAVYLKSHSVSCCILEERRGSELCQKWLHDVPRYLEGTLTFHRMWGKR